MHLHLKCQEHHSMIVVNLGLGACPSVYFIILSL